MSESRDLCRPQGSKIKAQIKDFVCFNTFTSIICRLYPVGGILFLFVSVSCGDIGFLGQLNCAA